MIARYWVAHELKMTVAQLGDMTMDEFTHWLAFLEIRANAKS